MKRESSYSAMTARALQAVAIGSPLLGFRSIHSRDLNRSARLSFGSRLHRRQRGRRLDNQDDETTAANDDTTAWWGHVIPWRGSADRNGPKRLRVRPVLRLRKRLQGDEETTTR